MVRTCLCIAASKRRIRLFHSNGQIMTRILLIYPFFKPRHDRSSFRFPPLGLGYLASSLKVSGYRPEILDCTFLEWDEARAKAVDTKADIVGIYSMVTMHEECLMFAKLLKNRCDLLIAGGPLPSCDPNSFLDDCDLVVMGEGEQTILEIVKAYEAGLDFGAIKGLAYRLKDAQLRRQRGNCRSIWTGFLSLQGIYLTIGCISITGRKDSAILPLRL